jgi:hypothetical protein
MTDKFILTDGQKSAALLTSDDPNVWNFFGGTAKAEDITLYARVAAAFRAYNLKANTVGNMPFALMKGKDEYDTSASWENKVGFLPNPSELLRLDTLSYMATNTVYNMRTSDALGYKTRGLYHAVPFAFMHWTDPATGNFLYDERLEAGKLEKYYPDDKRIVRMWRLDHTTEVLPSPNTEAGAIANAAGVAYYADSWIKHFFERGGVAPTVIAMKGAIGPGKREEEEKSWTDWLLGLGSRFRSRIARVFNADALDVKQFGSSVTELKDNQVYSQALANIAMGTGMPLSLLLANSANYATAKEEKSTWYENDIIPLCNWLAYEYNRQVFNSLGLRLEFHPETLDPQQEDETQRAAAISTFMDFLAKCPTYDIFIGVTSTFGYELSDDLVEAAKDYYAQKEQAAAVVATQTTPAQETPVEDAADTTAEPDDAEDTAPAKFIPSLDQMRELKRWQELAFRKLKRAEPLPTDWRNDTLPDEIYNGIVTGLQSAKDDTGIKAAFDVAMFETTTPAPEYKTDILELAAALNRYAEAITTKGV